MGPVTTWMGDCLRAGLDDHLGGLSLLSSVGW